jgi:hypothetical protein
MEEKNLWMFVQWMLFARTVAAAQRYTTETMASGDSVALPVVQKACTVGGLRKRLQTTPILLTFGLCIAMVHRSENSEKLLKVGKHVENYNRSFNELE